MELYTVNETAEMLRVSPITIRRYIASGRLAAVRFGRNVRVRREAVDQLLELVHPGVNDDFDERIDMIGKPFTRDDALWSVVGMGRSGPPDDLAQDDEDLPTLLEALGISVGIGRSGESTNIAEHKDEYVADAIEARG